MEALSPDVLADRIEAGTPVTLLDVRNRDEVDEWRIDGPSVERVHIPYMQFVAAQARGESTAPLPDGLTEPLIVVCARGEASDEVATALRAAGVEARNLAGGMNGWGRVYRMTELAADAGNATVIQCHRPATGCLAYLVIADGEALVVDPLRAFVDRYAAAARDRGATLVAALDTHVHADHLSGLRTLGGDGVTPYLSVGAADRGTSFPAETVAAGDTLTVGDVDCRVRATPGHTTGGISLLVGNVLLCGDTLFVDGVARPDLEPEADATAHARDLHRTLTERLADLPDTVTVAPGHHGPAAAHASDGSYTAQLGHLRDTLWAFDADQSAFVERVLDGLGPRPANDQRIVAINLGHEQADDETAFELELGPNNCAVSV